MYRSNRFIDPTGKGTSKAPSASLVRSDSPSLSAHKKILEDDGCVARLSRQELLARLTAMRQTARLGPESKYLPLPTPMNHSKTPKPKSKPTNREPISPIGIKSPKQLDRTDSASLEGQCSWRDSLKFLQNIPHKPVNFALVAGHCENIKIAFELAERHSEEGGGQNLIKKVHKEISDLKAELASDRNEFEMERAELRESLLKSQNDTSKMGTELQIVKFECEQYKKELNSLQDELKSLRELKKDYETKLEIMYEEYKEIVEGLETEKENVEYLQNFMADLIQQKDDQQEELRKLKATLNEVSTKRDALEKEVTILRTNNDSVNSEKGEVNDGLEREDDKLEKEKMKGQGEDLTSKITNLESQSQEERLVEELNGLKICLEQKNKDYERLKGREEYLKESNEIFQQKLIVLNETIRKIRGDRPPF